MAEDQNEPVYVSSKILELLFMYLTTDDSFKVGIFALWLGERPILKPGPSPG